MPTLFGTNTVIHEQSSARYRCIFKDVEDEQINSAAVTAILCTLRDVKSGQVMADRDVQNVLNANGGTLAGDGVFTLDLSDDDNAIVSAVNQYELRHLTLDVTYDDGRLTHRVDYYVRALPDIPML